MMQPVIAETILSGAVLTGQGFLARSLLAWPASTIGTRNYVEIDLTDDHALAVYRRSTKSHLERRLVLRPESRNELEPRTVTLAPTAKQRWIRIHNALEADTGCLRPTTGRPVACPYPLSLDPLYVFASLRLCERKYPRPHLGAGTATTLDPTLTENFNGVLAFTSISQPSGVSNVASFPK